MKDLYHSDYDTDMIYRTERWTKRQVLMSTVTQRRKPNAWNAFIRTKLKNHNEGECELSSSFRLFDRDDVLGFHGKGVQLATASNCTNTSETTPRNSEMSTTSSLQQRKELTEKNFLLFAKNARL